MRDFTTGDRNIAIFYITSMAQACAFITGNWIFFWLRVMTFGELGIVDAASFAFGLLMEVPTGAISDMVGRKHTLTLALVCSAFGFGIMAAADVIWVLVAGFWIAQIGWAFYSGAAEALAFDSLKERGQEARFDRVMANATSISLVTLVVCSLIGAWFYQIDQRLPHYAWAVAFALAALATLWLREPTTGAQRQFSLRTYTTQLATGFRQLWQPTLRRFVPLIFATTGAYYLFSFGLVSPTLAVGFGFDADAQAVIFALAALASAVIQTMVPWLRRRLPEYTGLILIAGALALGFAGGAFPLGTWGVGVLLLIRLAGSLSNTWISIIVNNRIDSAARATTLSAVALLTKIPYVATAVLAGAMAEAGTFPTFSAGVAVFVGLICIWSLLAFSRRAARRSPA